MQCADVEKNNTCATFLAICRATVLHCKCCYMSPDRCVKQVTATFVDTSSALIHVYGWHYSMHNMQRLNSTCIATLLHNKKMRFLV